jgi:hypothetical protein
MNKIVVHTRNRSQATLPVLTFASAAAAVCSGFACGGLIGWSAASALHFSTGDASGCVEMKRKMSGATALAHTRSKISYSKLHQVAPRK